MKTTKDSSSRNLPPIIAIVGTILFFAGMACQADQRSELLAKEQQLRRSLDILRKTIDAYTYDKRKAPRSLEDLVRAGYLKKIPADPITSQANSEVVPQDTWNTGNNDQSDPGIDDVRSASPEMSTEGTPYNTW